MDSRFRGNDKGEGMTVFFDDRTFNRTLKLMPILIGLKNLWSYSFGLC